MHGDGPELHAGDQWKGPCVSTTVSGLSVCRGGACALPATLYSLRADNQGSRRALWPPSVSSGQRQQGAASDSKLWGLCEVRIALASDAPVPGTRSPGAEH
jgi:hypothetical protein